MCLQPLSFTQAVLHYSILSMFLLITSTFFSSCSGSEDRNNFHIGKWLLNCTVTYKAISLSFRLECVAAAFVQCKLPSRNRKKNHALASSNFEIYLLVKKYNTCMPHLHSISTCSSEDDQSRLDISPIRILFSMMT